MNNNHQILIVDDTPANLDLLANLLEIENYRVIQAISGAEALKKLESHKADLILLDIMMPEMDGYEVCRTIKANPAISDIPVIFLTAKNEIEDIVEGFAAGGVDYIQKPFNGMELFMRIQTHLQLYATSRALEQKNQELNQKNKLLTDSINYAKRIQNAVLPDYDTLKQFLPEHFVLNLPKDIVSGDFFWVKQINNKLLACVADCTGHGVSGAFMGILGVAFLNEIALNRDFTKPSHYLEELRTKVKKTLRQPQQRVSHDGMTLAFCMIDYETKMMQYSGAQASVILIRDYNEHPEPFNENTERNEKYSLTEIKGNRSSIGFTISDEKFTDIDIQLYANDLLYMYSDGFLDQIGGRSGKRFTSRAFRNMLLKNSNYTMHEQKIQIENIFNDWRDEMYQVDDILIFGFKIHDSYGDLDLF